MTLFNPSLFYKLVDLKMINNRVNLTRSSIKHNWSLKGITNRLFSYTKPPQFTRELSNTLVT